MESYDIPVTVSADTGESLTPEQASASLDKIYSAAVNDKKHPFFDGHNFQHKKYVDAVTALHKIKASTIDADGNLVERTSPIEQACNEAMELQTQKQDKLRIEAGREIEKLEELGYENTADLPDVVQPYLLRGLTEQRLHATGDFQSLLPMLEKDCQDLRDYESLEILRSFKTTAVFDEDFQREALDKAIRKIHALNVKKYTVKK
jgi:hypothetical protein